MKKKIKINREKEVVRNGLSDGDKGKVSTADGLINPCVNDIDVGVDGAIWFATDEEYLFLMVLAGKILPGSKTNMDPERVQCNTIIF